MGGGRGVLFDTITVVLCKLIWIEQTTRRVLWGGERG